MLQHEGKNVQACKCFYGASTLTITTFSIMTLCVEAFSIKDLIVTLRIIDTPKDTRISFQCHYAICRYAECRVLFKVMLKVIILSVRLNAIILSVIYTECSN